jgi:galactan 5-O-arabinofuranosyltransferase
MKKINISRAFTSFILVITFCFIGLLVVQYFQQIPATSQEMRNYGFMGLDFWNLLFVFAVVLLWVIPGALPSKRIAMLFILGVYGAIALSLVFAPSPFPDNGFCGDQKFRMAMIERFTSSGWPTDYYFKGLPIFYPPVYYLVLGLLGKLTSHHGYEMLQIGLKLLFLFMPFLLFWMWRKIVSPTSAIFITSAIILIDVAGSFMLVGVPHAFISNSLFIPWWLYYIQGIGCSPRFSWSTWISGSIIGALLLATYFYPFFILGFMLVIFTCLVISRSHSTILPVRNLHQVWFQILGVGVFSAPYWFPNLLSIIHFGMDRSRGDFYHSNSGGLGFPFLEFNWIGLIGAAGILFALWRVRSRILRSLLWLLAVCLGFYLLGSLLGAIDFSLNLTKDREFTWAVMTTLIGLSIFSGVQWILHRRNGRIISIGTVTIIMLICVRGMISFAHDSTVERSRTSNVLFSDLPSDFVLKLKDHVLLTYGEEIYAFIPIYAFINVNEHYAHPASRFALRYDFLHHLTGVRDSRVLNVAMRNNQFDAVDYLIPEHVGESFRFQVALSNYPNGLILKDLSFSASLLSDTSGFSQFPGFGLFEVRSDITSIPKVKIDASNRCDSLIQMSHIAAIQDRLQPIGKDIIERSLPKEFPKCVRYLDASHPYWFDKKILLIDCHSFSFEDSIYLVMSFRINRQIPNPRRVYLHVFPEENDSELVNFDFPPDINSSNWQVGDVITLCRTLPNQNKSISFVLGLFDNQGSNGKSFYGVVSSE